MTKTILGIPVTYDDWGRCTFTLAGKRYRGTRSGVKKTRVRWTIHDDAGNEIGTGSVASVIAMLQSRLPVPGQYQDETDWWEARA